ncbi:MAG: proline--tRNA ligase, partial [Chitinophagaceae bacterium]
QQLLDKRFKDTGHTNAYFPLLIPKSFFTKEASHIEGFAKECAVVTHYRLKTDTDTQQIIVDEKAKLEEELIVRPTSETIIWNTYKDWISSYRDLPILVNQWANVVRWEMRTRLFLRTTEFLWQEGHTAHATKQEAIEETEKILDIYADFLEKEMAIPVIKGVKTANERFAGALETYCIEALMQDGKALQAGTSHFLGQNFSKAFDVKFLTPQNQYEYVWATSWGVSTRLIGALIMCHSDNQGLQIPPRIAPYQVVLVPIFKGEDSIAVLNEYAEKMICILKEKNIRYKWDKATTMRPGWKFAEYELKGVPIRISFGMKEVEKKEIEIARRDKQEKRTISFKNLEIELPQLLEDIQKNMYNRALEYRNHHITQVDTWQEFEKVLKEKGGFIAAHWDGTLETENKIKELTKATIRCIPLNHVQEKGKCILTGKESIQRVLFAIAY